MEVEEDGPLEDWTVKELKEECKSLGLADKGKKTELIERIKDARASAPAVEAAVEEAVVEEAAVEETAIEGAAVEEAAVEDAAVEEAAVEEAAVEEAAVEEVAEVDSVEEPAAEGMEVEDDGPLEDWTVKELKEECETLGLADKGKKAELIERIKDARATAPAVEAAVEEAAVEEAAVEEAPAEEIVEEP